MVHDMKDPKEKSMVLWKQPACSIYLHNFHAGLSVYLDQQMNSKLKQSLVKLNLPFLNVIN